MILNSSLRTFFILMFFLLQLHLSAQSNKPRKCIMVFGAHADDADENAGGTLAKYVAMGYQGVYVVAINNLDGCNLERTPCMIRDPILPFPILRTNIE